MKQDTQDWVKRATLACLRPLMGGLAISTVFWIGCYAGRQSIAKHEELVSKEEPLATCDLSNAHLLKDGSLLCQIDEAQWETTMETVNTQAAVLELATKTITEQRAEIARLKREVAHLDSLLIGMKQAQEAQKEK